jgi:hypothetical protein
VATDRRFQLTPGPAQWAELRWRSNPSDPDLVAYVRFELVDEKRWRVAELRMLDPTPVALRTLPLIRIEHAANADSVLTLALAIRRYEEQPADVPSWFRSNTEPVPEHLVDRIYEWHERPSSEDRFRLRRPAGRNLGDGFYREVARAYTAAVAAGLNPRKALAEDAATPADTVARWTAEARRRGYLPPARVGRVTPMDEVVQEAVQEAARETLTSGRQQGDG